MNRVVPVGDGTYVQVDENGDPIGAPFNPLDTFGMLDRSSSGGTTTIGPDGKAIAAPMSAPAPPPMPGAETAPVEDVAYDDMGQAVPRRTSSRQVASNSGAYQGRQTYDPVFGPPATFGMDDGGDPFASIPNYLNGQRHPAAGGAPLVPGGIFAQQQAEEGDQGGRGYVSVPGGASITPYSVTAASSPRQSAQGGGTFFNDEGRSGGGGNTSPTYDALRAKGNAMAGKLKGYGGGGGSDDYTDPTKQYRRQGRRMDRAYDRYNDELADPDPMPVHGWTKDQGIKPGTVDAVLSDPSMVLEYLYPGFMRNETTRSLTDLPMTDLALMSFGTQGRDLMSRTPVVKPPKILRQNGVDPIKPEYKRSLDSSKVTNKIAEMYKTIGQDRNFRFDSQELIGNLANADNKSAVRQGIEQQARFGNPGDAFNSIRSYITSANDAAMDNSLASQDYLRSLDDRLRGMGPQFLNLKPKQADKAVNTIAQQFLL